VSYEELSQEPRDVSLAEMPADLILRDGRIRTLLSPGDISEAVALRGDRIIATGDTAQMERLAGPETRVVDLQGATVIPGFIDVHVHLENATRYDRRLDSAASRADLVERVGAMAAQRAPDEWLVAAGAVYDSSFWPRRAELDGVTEGRPAVISLSGSAHVLNSRGLSAMLPDAENALGVTVERDPETGEPTGLVRTRGADGLHALLPGAPIGDKATIRGALTRGMRELSAAGITTAHHMIKSSTPVQIYQDLHAERRLPIRVGLLIRGYESDIDLNSVIQLGLRQGFGDKWLRLQGVKLSVDGYFPEGGSAFSEPYADDPGSTGRLRIAPDDVFDYIARAHRAGLRCCVHANGDRAVDIALEGYRRALREVPRTDHRHRIEHVGNLYLTEQHIRNLRELGVVAVPNPPFFHRRARFMAGRLGPARGVRPVAARSLLDGGVRVVAASDYSGLYPVDPLLGMSALVTRKTQDGMTFAPEEAIDAWTALRLYTTEAAWLSFEENRKGTIEPGKFADLAILSDDPVAVAPERIGGCSVLATLVGATAVHAEQDFRELLEAKAW
jgi:predicted amidohydrolase YtcJ